MPSQIQVWEPIGDRVWLDSDGNGIQNLGEAGIEGITLTIYTDSNGDGEIDSATDSPFTAAVDQNNNTGTGTTTTESDGTYIFAQLPVNRYAIVATPPAGFIQTGDPDDMIDNQGEPIIIGPGDTNLRQDFGYQPDGSTTTSDIGDKVYFDANANGSQDVEDRGIPNVTISLFNGTNDLLATDITDENGDYLFPELPDGAYKVVITDNDNILTGMTNSGDPDGNTSDESIVTLSGSSDLLQDFGYTPSDQTPTGGIIGDLIYLDYDGDNTPDPDEGMEGIIVYLYDDSNNLLDRTITNENGIYFFGDLVPENYVVRIDQASLPSALNNSVDPDGGTPHEAALTLGAGEVNLDQDFGYLPNIPGSIGNKIWRDLNANGVLDSDELGIEGVTLRLYVDANGDQNFDSGDKCIAYRVSGPTGEYQFTNLPTQNRAGGPIDYFIVVTDNNKRLNGHWHSRGTAEADNNSQTDEGYLVRLDGGNGIVNNTTADMGYYDQPAAVGNRVWEDTNQNGLQDSGETGMSGVEVTLEITYPDGSTLSLIDSTDNDGYYNFTNLLTDESYDGQGTFATPGTGGGDEPYFRLTVSDPDGYTPTLLNVNGAADDKIDSEDPAGTQAILSKGSTNTLLLADPTQEKDIASYDFGYRIIDLPLNLISFEGSEVDCNTALKWVTKSEKDVLYFELQRSQDGIEFDLLERINAAGNTTIEKLYAYTDKQPLQQNYYRLKIVDSDGTFRFSPIINVAISCDGQFENGNLYPNPVAQGPIHVVLEAPKEVKGATMLVFDVLGRKQLEINRDIPKGTSILDVDTNQLGMGTYHIVIMDANRQVLFSDKFFKIAH